MKPYIRVGVFVFTCLCAAVVLMLLCDLCRCTSQSQAS